MKTSETNGVEHMTHIVAVDVDINLKRYYKSFIEFLAKNNLELIA
jgi:hypothetical protein